MAWSCASQSFRAPWAPSEPAGLFHRPGTSGFSLLREIRTCLSSQSATFQPYAAQSSSCYAQEQELGPRRDEGMNAHHLSTPCHLNHYFRARKDFKGHSRIHGDTVTSRKGQKELEFTVCWEKSWDKKPAYLLCVASGMTWTASMAPVCLESGKCCSARMRS